MSTPVNIGDIPCRAAPEQLSIQWSERDAVNQAWRGDGENGLALVQEFVQARTLKDVAYVLDEQPSGLAHELAERDYREAKARLIIMAVMDRRRRGIIHWLCRLAGGRFVEDTPLTTDEELRRTREWLKANPALEQSWRSAVHGGRR